jgi:N-acetylglucosamine-6-sulfatase
MSRGITRREALGGIAAGVMGTAALGACGGKSVASVKPPAVTPPRRAPNMVFILADDQAVSATGASGRFPFLQTPGMDRLAAEGATFTNTFVTTSLCSPSRASLLTGCYAHTHGVTQNDVMDPKPEVPQFPALLQKAGYRTAYMGKWHMAAGATGSPRPGFDTWLSMPGQGEYDNPTLNDNGSLSEVPGYLTDILTERATQWITENQSSPFCLVLAHKAVHDPRTPAARHANAFPDAAIPEPPNFQDDCFGKPEWLRRAILHGDTADAWQASAGLAIPDRLPPASWNGKDPYLLQYFRCLLGLDESIRRVLETLESLGILDDTCVVHMSDNGYFFGEHRRGDKRLMYEESIRVPLLVRYPHVFSPASRVASMALNIDIGPTFLALAGVEQPAGMQGTSLVPLAAGVPSTWRKSFLYEYWMEGWMPGIPSIRGVRTDNMKLIRYPDVVGDTDEIYDLARDPLELTNRIQDPAYTQTVVALDAELARLSGTGAGSSG